MINRLILVLFLLIYLNGCNNTEATSTGNSENSESELIEYEFSGPEYSFTSVTELIEQEGHTNFNILNLEYLPEGFSLSGLEKLTKLKKLQLHSFYEMVDLDFVSRNSSIVELILVLPVVRIPDSFKLENYEIIRLGKIEDLTLFTKLPDKLRVLAFRYEGTIENEKKVEEIILSFGSRVFIQATPVRIENAEY